MKNHLTLDQLKRVLRYEPTTGVFTWLVDAGTNRAGHVAGSMDSKGYTQIGFGRRCYRAHRLAWLYVHGAWPEHVIDHCNGDKTDNRIANLRDVTQAVNLQNLRKPSGKNKTSPFIGVWRAHGSTRWVSRITVNGRRFHLGYFETAEAGHEAYIEAKRRLHEGCTL